MQKQLLIVARPQALEYLFYGENYLCCLSPTPIIYV